MAVVYVAYERSDGGVSYTAIRDKIMRGRTLGEVVTDEIRKWAESEAVLALTQQREPRAIVRWAQVEEDLDAKDRAFRGAWEFADGAVGHNMHRARDIYRERLREARVPLLKALDVEYQRADEAEDKDAKRAIAAQKQRLRDAPADPRIEACQTVEELSVLDVLSEEASLVPR